MDKRNKKTMIHKILYSNLKIKQREPTKNLGWTQVLRKGEFFVLQLQVEKSTVRYTS
jgi:hypothetical protein